MTTMLDRRRALRWMLAAGAAPLARAGSAGSALAATVAGGCVAPRRRGASLVVYAAGPRGLADAMCRAFTGTEGIGTELYCATSGQVMAKLEAERFNPRADVVVLASALAAGWLKREGRLQPAADPREALPASPWDDPDGMSIATGAAAVGIALRHDLMDGSITWDDVFRGRLAARSVMPAPSRSGSAADFVLTWVTHRGDGAWTQFRSARAAGMEIAGANAQALSGLLLGARDVVIAAVDSLVCREMARGAAVALHFPREGVPIIPRPAVILRHVRNVDAARRFIRFLRSSVAQDLVAAAHMLPARADTPLSAVRRAIAAPVPLRVDQVAVLRAQRSVLRRFQYEVERVAAPRRDTR